MREEISPSVFRIEYLRPSGRRGAVSDAVMFNNPGFFSVLNQGSIFRIRIAFPGSGSGFFRRLWF